MSALFGAGSGGLTAHPTLPRISVVTAVWNRRATIGPAIESVQSQSYDRVEHVIQDGGSRDGTLAEIAARADGRTRLVSAPDAGLYDAINRGIARARGDVIGLMHSDDAYAGPEVLAWIAAGFEDPDVDAVYGDLDYVAAADPGRVVRRWRSRAFHPALLARGWMPPHPTLYLRRRVLEAGGLYDTGFRIAADYDAVLRWFARPGFRAVYIPRVLVRMRMGGASTAGLAALVRKSREDLAALRRSGIGSWGTLAAKNLGKIGQFVPRRQL